MNGAAMLGKRKTSEERLGGTNFIPRYDHNTSTFGTAPTFLGIESDKCII